MLGELRAGFRQGTRRERNEELLREFLSSPRMRVVPVDDETSDRYAEIVALLRRQGRPIPTNDIWIAAQTMEHGAELITTDQHFEKIDGLVYTLFTL